MRTSSFFSKLAAAVFLVSLQVNAQGSTECFQNCINENSEGFNCVGLDIPCYCGWEDGQFFPRFRSCVQQNCGQFAALLSNCPSRSPTGQTVVPTTISETLTLTGEDTVTNTIETTVVDRDTLTLIGDETTTTFTETNVAITTITTEGETTRVVVITTASTDNVTVPIGSGSTIIPVTSTQYTTLTSGEETVTRAVTTHTFSTAVPTDSQEPAPTTSTDAAVMLSGDLDGMLMSLLMGVGMVAGFLGFM